MTDPFKLDGDCENPECGPYWLLRSLAEWVSRQKVGCERDPDGCRNTGDCITEYCSPCAARLWLAETKERERNSELGIMCAHGIREGEYCEACNAEYKRAAREQMRDEA